VILPPAGAVEIAVEVDATIPSFPALPSPAGPGETRRPPAPTPDAPGVARDPARGTSVPAPSRPVSLGPTLAPRSAPSVQRSQPTADASAGWSPHRPARGPLPFDFPRPLQAGGSSSSTGGSAPSLLLFGLATLIGLFVFAAPGLGRRIRLARLPSPRGRYHSPLDRPG
jgi:hypothetical protein